MTGPLLQVNQGQFSYGEVPVVRDLDLTVEAGQVMALLGPNGAGKTTTLGACAGFVSVTGGEILFDGRSIAGQSAQKLARLGVSHVPEGRGIFHSLTVDEHFRLAGRGADVDGVLKYFPKLEELRERRAGLLSGGEQQMLALASALLRRPRLLLIDELSLGLAPIIVEALLPIVRAFADDFGCGVVLVEQHVNLALEIADAATVLVHGKVVLSGDAEPLRGDREVIMASYMGAQELTESVS
jgi:ABC-type branched-subunit amino acid transport system ATPase component